MKVKVFDLAYLVILFIQLDRIIRYLTRNRVAVISYHDPKPDIFTKHINYLSKHYNFISLDDFMEAKLKNPIGKLPKNSMVVTIDDGHKGNKLLFDILEQYQVKPTIYCCSNVVGTDHHYWWHDVPKSELEYYKNLNNKDKLSDLGRRYGYSLDSCGEEDGDALTLSDLRHLVAIGGIVGGHTRNHPILSKCDDEELEDEIVFSKFELEKKINREVKHFAYPNGTYTKEVLAYIEKAGYISARTTRTGWNTKNTKNTELKVIGISDDASLKKLRVTLTGLPGMIVNLLYSSNY